MKNSPGHFKNTVNPVYTKVGIGIVLSSNRQYYLTLMFSVRNLKDKPLGASELSGLQSMIIGEIKA